MARYDITPVDVAAAGCNSYEPASWRLRMHIRNDRGDFWTKAETYHSRTPHYSAIYRAQLVLRAAKWGAWLEARFPTLDVIRDPAPRSANPQRAAATAFAPKAIGYTAKSITASVKVLQETELKAFKSP